MGLKAVTREPISEGPMDFMRGAAGATGAKIATAARNTGQAVKRGVNDVVQAGQQASAAADFEKLVYQFAQAFVQYSKLKGGASEPAQQEKPADKPSDGVPDQFRTTEKPKGRMGPHGFEYTFSSFMQATHGERIDEGVWDFVKGAGNAVKSKVSDKINSYANGAGNTFRDIYKAGQEASAQGDKQKEAAQLGQAKQQAIGLLRKIVDIMKQVGGDRSPQMLKNATGKLPPDLRDKVYKVIVGNLNR